MSQPKLKFAIRVEYDADTEYPFEYNEVWKFVTLRMNLTSDVPEGWTLADEEIAPEEHADRVFPVSCYRHSGSHWFLPQDNPNSCQWDTRRLAGYLILRDPDQIPKENRLEAARATIKEYDQWANGDCWWFRAELETEQPAEPGATLHGCPSCQCGPALPRYEMEEVENCGGFIGEDYVVEELVATVQGMRDRGQLKPETHVVHFHYPKHSFYHCNTFAEAVRKLGLECELDGYNS